MTMKRFGLMVMALVMSGIPSVALSAQTPAFDPRSWKGAHVGPPTRVLTIGSAHLSQIEKPVSAEMLAPLIERLAAFAPQIITVEGLSGEQCDTLERYAATYPGMFDTYCWPTQDARTATGLSVPQALAAIDTTLAAWPSAPTAAAHRRLAALFLAAGDRPSAQVQWQQLPANERRIGDGIDPALLAILSRKGAKPNETYAIAVALAARLGLQRVFAVDDHTADSVQALAGSGFEPFMQDVWKNAKSPTIDENRRRETTLATGTDVLDLYRFLNAPATQRALLANDYKRAIDTPSPQSYGRTYLAWWEVRNLRMVASIRSAFGNRPGARVLNIVGASHKAYYDAYLDMMSDVRIVDAEAVLK